MKKIASRTALAYTMGMEPSELSEYRYQPGRFPVALYAIDDGYYCCRKTKPALQSPWDNLRWEKFVDQFWAEQAGTVIWKAQAE